MLPLTFSASSIPPSRPCSPGGTIGCGGVGGRAAGGRGGEPGRRQPGRRQPGRRRGRRRKRGEQRGHQDNTEGGPERRLWERQGSPGEGAGGGESGGGGQGEGGGDGRPAAAQGGGWRWWRAGEQVD